MDNNNINELGYIMDQTYASLVAVSNKLQTAGDSYSDDLTIKQLLALLAILHIPEGNATIIHIAGKLATTKQNATRIIKSLEKKNYIKVVPSEKDKRAVNVVLTEAGIHSLSKNSKDAKKNFMTDIFNDFSKEELKTLWQLLKKLYSYDGVPMDGFEERVKMPNISAEVLE
ncbi:MarR family transcriptional regulator [Clostridium beijerinckii]|nr:transcriptional activatory protein BadR [Clostridium beijerinckii]MBC2419031.1 MarR family transcriptional regulator [Clostridium beijerinckii]MBC2424344.1 MarR family transcriptional regulator [Clostridium beijerinckii]MBC2434028.1 MarR family transcriptional regulator [Clostridium beijerinckii]MBC2491293.1 MarR family transcriptional regulator [Clostridium beijerinckii]